MRSEPPPPAIALELVIPDVLGNLAVTMVERHLGKTLETIIGRFSGGAQVVANNPTTQLRERIYPIRIPPQDGLWLSLPGVGDIGFQNDQGQLLLLTPASAQSWVQTHLGNRVRSSRVVDATLQTWLHTQPGPVLVLPMLNMLSLRLQVPAPKTSPT